MFQRARFAVGSIALFLLAAASTTAVAAAPVRNMHSFFTGKAATNQTVQIKLHNKGSESQDVKVNDKVYTVKPNAIVTIKAPAGTQVYAASAGAQHKSGDVLFALTPELDGMTVSFN